jgi:hypothetical protein
MKYIILAATLVLTLSSYSQYSTYYGTGLINNKQVNANINLTSKVNSTITSIDYGSLALANAEREKTRLQSLQYANELEKQRALEIAVNPMKAFDYGRDNQWELKKDIAKMFGYKKLTFYHKIPHNSLFTAFSGERVGYNYRNVSEENIVTEITLEPVLNINGIENGPYKDTITNFFKLLLENPEEYSKFNSEDRNFVVGTFFVDKYFLHKKELKRANVYGIDGFKSTLIYEDDYELVIKDYFNASINGKILQASVKYKGAKGEITFEQLEGRRYYLKRLCEQIIATTTFPNAIERD